MADAWVANLRVLIGDAATNQMKTPMSPVSPPHNAQARAVALSGAPRTLFH